MNAELHNGHYSSNKLRGASRTISSNFSLENGKITSNRAVLSVERYRKITGHNDLDEEIILKRLHFIEGLCRHIIKSELNNYASKKNATTNQ